MPHFVPNRAFRCSFRGGSLNHEHRHTSQPSKGSHKSIMISVGHPSVRRNELILLDLKGKTYLTQVQTALYYEAWCACFGPDWLNPI
jgi:hypothetical protein